MQTFTELRDRRQLSFDAFVDESRRRFSAVCELGPTETSTNSYDYDSWHRVCEGDHPRLQQKLGSRGRLIRGISPEWSGKIVPLDVGQAQLDRAISAYFTRPK